MTPERKSGSGLFPMVARAARLLVVDDDPEVRRGVKRALSTRGYDVAVTECGTQAMVAILNQGPFDAIISDVDMPRGCGVALLYRLRGLNNPHAKRFVFHSSHTNELVCHKVPIVKRKGDIDSIEEALAQL
jgi:CheY-like chemotaxis protein